MTATDALWQHNCRFTSPLEIELGIIDQDISDSTPRSVRDYLLGTRVDSSMQLSNPKTKLNDANLSRRYSHYPRRPKLRWHVLSGDEDSVIKTTEPIPVIHIIINPAPSRAPIISAVKWIQSLVMRNTPNY